MTAVSYRLRKGNLRAMNSLTPTFCSPTAFSIPHGGLHDPRGRIPGSGFERQAFDDDRPEAVQIDEGGILLTIAEGPRGGHDGVLQGQAADGYRKIRGCEAGFFRACFHMCSPSPPGAVRRISLRSKTGPSLQTLTYSLFPSGASDRYRTSETGPTPQAIRSSMETWQGMGWSLSSRPRDWIIGVGPQANRTVSFGSYPSISLFSSSVTGP